MPLIETLVSRKAIEHVESTQVLDEKNAFHS